MSGLASSPPTADTASASDRCDSLASLHRRLKALCPGLGLEAPALVTLKRWSATKKIVRHADGYATTESLRHCKPVDRTEPAKTEPPTAGAVIGQIQESIQLLNQSVDTLKKAAESQKALTQQLIELVQGQVQRQSDLEKNAHDLIGVKKLLMVKYDENNRLLQAELSRVGAGAGTARGPSGLDTEMLLRKISVSIQRLESMVSGQQSG